MKNFVVLLAGGVGTRVGASVPKQFIIINNKPVIIHTLLCFEKSEKIDGILIVCNKDWITYMEALVNEYDIKKVKWIIAGGSSAHESTRNGVFFLEDKIGHDDYVIVHDSVRPILPQAAINNMIATAHEKGNASLCVPCYETVIKTTDGLSGTQDIDRDSFRRIQTPQAYRYDKMLSLYKRAEKEGKRDFVYADLVYIYYGERIFFSKGFTNNIKITRKEDVSFCEALMNFSEEELYSL